MYKVFEMYGDYEPWWFLDGWETDVTRVTEFEDYYEALSFYKRRWLDLSEDNPQYESRSDLMTAFWNPTDQRWCEECDEFLQQYHSVFLLENGAQIPKEKWRPAYSKHKGAPRHPVCRVGG